MRRIALESHKSGLFWLFSFLITVDFSSHILSFEKGPCTEKTELTSRRLFKAAAIVFVGGKDRKGEEGRTEAITEKPARRTF